MIIHPSTVLIKIKNGQPTLFAGFTITIRRSIQKPALKRTNQMMVALAAILLPVQINPASKREPSPQIRLVLTSYHSTAGPVSDQLFCQWTMSHPNRYKPARLWSTKRTPISVNLRGRFNRGIGSFSPGAFGSSSIRIDYTGHLPGQIGCSSNRLIGINQNIKWISPRSMPT